MDTPTAQRFSALQADLAEAWLANLPGSDADHSLIALPSHSVAESLLAHYGPRVRALEHRYLVVYLMLHRVPHCELVFLCTQQPDHEVIEYYDSLVAAHTGRSALERFRVVVVDDGTPRSVSAKLLDRPDLLEELRACRRGRLAFVQPWNVTDLEVRVALELGMPMNGTSPELWPLGYKSAGRRMMREAGVPVPYGHEDVRSVDDVVAAVTDIQTARPEARGVVMKLDDSGAGDGNVVVGLRAADGSAADLAEIRERVETLASWYLTDLAAGGVVEELVSAPQFRSPSVQVGISPHGEVTVLASHEQVLGGDSAQVFTGCRFPADRAYAPQIAHHAETVGQALAARGAVGRAGVDFAVAGDDAGRWDCYALEINLRNGGTTHPFAVLRNLVPGAYDVRTGRWVAEADGSSRAYRATDNMVDIAWLGLAPSAVIAAVSDAGLDFDHVAGTGVVLHMLSCLAIDGRFGLTAIGRDEEHADWLLDATREAVDRISRS
ncbi:hypothetical protein D0Z08_31300 [Nocardioides immobilis]|uniref:ATP-grasp domain-containing protein n=1 Tax=Nocardioides immobilis TaxID=2049295 RepID=A0A417XRM7_9ACTN|nr:peptide ligase PGM1-related protein [Nocardioides immobilis]RHW22743.1 hypothetical protein D0Z08_31300 [Nocardioides immobilis]